MVVRLPAPLAALRRRRVPTAPLGVPPHVTVMYPFAPPDELEGEMRRTLREVARNVEPFAFVMRSTALWSDAAVLLPEPRDGFVELTRRFQAAFPDFPIYGGRIPLDDFVPHVTIAEDDDREALAADVAALRSWLPVSGRAERLTVIDERSDGRWHQRWRIRLGR